MRLRPLSEPAGDLASDRIAMNLLSKRARVVVAMLSIFAVVQSASAGVVDDLRKLVDAGQFDGAYALAAKHTDLAGNPHYDFLYGLAAVNTNQRAQGVLALERHLMAVPANDRARLELAKAYFEMGDYTRSRQEFEFVLRYAPPPEVQKNIQRYLDQMTSREAASAKVAARMYLEWGLGHDSNVNAGTFHDSILGQQLAPNDSARASDSLFTQVMAGGQWLRRVDNSLTLHAGADFDWKHNPSAQDFNTHNLGGYMGFSVQKGPSQYKLTLSDGQLWVGGDAYRNTLSLTGEATRYGLGDGYVLSGVAQYAELNYADAFEDSDANMVTLGGGLQKTFATPWRPTLGLNLNWSNEANQNMRDWMSRDYVTARFSFSANPTQQLAFSLGLGLTRSDFEEVDLAFGTKRQDNTLVFDAGINYLIDKHWILRSDLQYTENRSNQDLYDYRRTMVGVRGRYLF